MENAAIKAFIKAQEEMGAVLKNAANPHLKSKYADLGSVMDAAMPALRANGFGLMQPAGADDRGHYVETVLMHESGERFVSRIYLVLGKQDMQALGSGHTYARRYGLLGMAGLVPEDDDGEATRQPLRQGQAASARPPAAPDSNNAAAIEAKATLLSAPDMPALQRAWAALPDALKREDMVADAKDTRKEQLTEAPF